VAQIVVVGGGLGGLAAAARLAKLGHRVSVVERSSRLGGVVRLRTDPDHPGFGWDQGPAAMTLPATLRDLFRKSGRPLERVLDLSPVEVRRHVFGDGKVLDLPLASRSGQFRAIEGVLGGTTARAWQQVVDDFTPTWETLRTRALEEPYAGLRSLGPRALRVLHAGQSLHAFARARLTDPRARRLLEYAAVAAGSEPARTPAFVAVQTYVERTFGLWTCPGGFARVADALAERLRERKVDVRLDTAVARIVVRNGAVAGLRLAGEGRTEAERRPDAQAGDDLAADAVVSDVDIRSLAGDLLDSPPRTLRRAALRLSSPPRHRIIHLGIRDAGDPGDELRYEPEYGHAYETVFHPPDDSAAETIVFRAPDDPALAPDGHRAVTVVMIGGAPSGATADHSDDPLDVLARRGLDLRGRVVASVGGEPISYGPVWRGALRGLGVPRNQAPVGGLHLVGGTAHPGPGVPSVLLGAAAVAQDIGPA
jgi:phytoene dehydrogenase-like protein